MTADFNNEISPYGKDNLTITLKKLSSYKAREFVDVDSYKRVDATVLNSVKSSIVCYTFPAYELVFMNRQMKEIFECDENNVLQIVQWMILNRLDKNSLAKIHDKAIIENENVEIQFDITFTNTHGAKVILQTNLEYFCTRGAGKLAVVNCFDITERTQLSDMMSWEKKQYRDALIANCEYHYGFDVTTGIVENDFEIAGKCTAGKMLGVTFPCRQNDFIKVSAQKFGSTLPDGSSIDFISSESLLKIFESGKSSFEFEIVARDGHYSRVSYLLSKRADGHVCAIVISHDITQMREEELRKQAQLEAANKSLNEQIKITKSFSNIYYSSWLVNIQEDTIRDITVPAELSRITSESHGKFSIARSIMIDFIGEQSKDAIRNILRTEVLFDRLKSRQTTSIEYRGTLNKWCRACVIVIDRDKFGQPLNMIYAVLVISDEKEKELEQEERLRKAYESAKRSSAAKTDFLARMSHDIRTPMNAIIGMTTIAQSHLKSPPKLGDCLGKIAISSKHLLSLINEILDMSSIESGKVSLGQEEFNLPKLLDELLVTLNTRVKDKHQTLNVYIEHVMHENVVADSLRIQQVFSTLLTNAIKYTPPAGSIMATLREVPAIMATNTCNQKDVAYYEFIVRDNGCGIKKSDIDNIFIPFEHQDNDFALSTAHIADRGAGLGLPIAKKIANMLGGDITVESVLSKGSVFTVTLCLKTQSNREVDISHLHGLKVIVTDDDEDSRMNTVSILMDMGLDVLYCHSCDSCKSCSGALDAIKSAQESGDVFALLSNYTLNTQEGLFAIKKLRGALKSGTPLILYSNSSTLDGDMDIREAGVDLFLEKPLFKSKLFLALSGLCNLRDWANIESLDVTKTPRYKGHRILLVDDNELNRDVACEILSMLGLDCDTAIDGGDAVEKFSKKPDGYYNLIFMDLQMPVLNGYEATRKIRSLSSPSSAATIPIIAMSANAFSEDVKESIDSGMNAHIAKPLDLKLLCDTLNKWL